jgi:hypothetical protein
MSSNSSEEKNGGEDVPMHDADEEVDEKGSPAQETHKRGGTRAKKEKIVASSKNFGGKKRKRQVEQDQPVLADEYEAAKAYHVPIARELRTLLQKDWHKFLGGFILSLPAAPSLTRIIADFHEQNPDLDATTKGIVADLVMLFEIELGRSLVYREERPQYKESLERAKEKNEPVSSIYGAYHFLRLFVQLPVLFHQMHERPKDSDVAEIIAVSTRLCKFLENHQTLFFAERYEPNNYFTAPAEPEPQEAQ